MPLNVSLRSLLAVGLLAAALLAAGCARQQDSLQAGGGVGVGAATPGSPQEFQASVGDRVFFETDSSALTPQAMQVLNRQVEWLNRYSQYSFTVEGHADERGTREYNLALGARRAAAVRDYMIARGLGASRIRTVSYGKERPVAVCDDISCWSQNRRAVTILGG
jgi:peptidoglycan-associated lipoprotein